MLDLLEFGEFFASWRLYLGVAATAMLCWLIIWLIPIESVRWAAAVPAAIVGIVLSFRWQVRADFDE